MFLGSSSVQSQNKGLNNNNQVNTMLQEKAKKVIEVLTWIINFYTEINKIPFCSFINGINVAQIKNKISDLNRNINNSSQLDSQIKNSKDILQMAMFIAIVIEKSNGKIPREINSGVIKSLIQ